MLLRSVLLSALLLTGASGPGEARQREGDRAGRAQLIPLPQIEDRIVPRMRGATYLGPEFHAGAGSYRLKFIRDGKVIWVDVDARTGRVLGTTE